MVGDFQVYLPMVPSANRAQTVNVNFYLSLLWPLFRVLHLTINMRVMASGDQRLEQFSKGLLALETGQLMVVMI